MWKFTKVDKDVGSLQLSDKRGRILFLADLHWDNQHCDLDALKEVLLAANKSESPIFIVGDLFCAMQGKWDARADQDQLRIEHRGNHYLDLLVTTAAKWFLPYASAIAGISQGNHETAILKRHQTDLLGRLAASIRALGGPLIPILSYRTFVRVTAHKCKYSARKTFDVLLYHGYGGGGEVTRGMIDNSRTRSQYFADVYVSGHIHRRNLDENRIERLSHFSDRIETKTQWFLRCAPFKVDLQADGWHVETGKGPRPMGGWWLEYELAVKQKNRQRHLEFELKPIPT